MADGAGRPTIPPEEPILRFFDVNPRLSDELKLVAEPFKMLAAHVMTLPRNAERSTALRKLLEAKDCAVRAALPPEGA